MWRLSAVKSLPHWIRDESNHMNFSLTSKSWQLWNQLLSRYPDDSVDGVYLAGGAGDWSWKTEIIVIVKEKLQSSSKSEEQILNDSPGLTNL